MKIDDAEDAGILPMLSMDRSDRVAGLKMGTIGPREYGTMGGVWSAHGG